MKEKRLVALLIASAITLVASLTISLGVAFALADPVAAVGLAEISYTVSSNAPASKTVVFDPAGTYDGDVTKDIIVNSYDDILYANEVLSESIKLLKVSVKNDQEKDVTLRFRVEINGKTNATNYTHIAIFDAVNYKWYDLNNNISEEFDLLASTNGNYVIATWVDDSLATEIVDLDTHMEMNVIIDKIDNVIVG